MSPKIVETLDFFRRHGVKPSQAHRWLDEFTSAPYRLTLGDEMIELEQAERDELVELLQGHSIHGAL